MKQELHDECDYTKEATAANYFGSAKGLGSDPRYRVPWIWGRSTERVLVMQKMDGVSVGGASVESLKESDRDEVRNTCLKSLNCTNVVSDCKSRAGVVSEGTIRVQDDADGSKLV